MPNGDTIHSAHSGNLPMPEPINMPAHVLPALNQSLISIGKLCDAGCTATFDAQTVTIHHDLRPILTGQRQKNGLWLLPTMHPSPTPSQTANTATPTPQANFTIHDAVLKDSIKFLHLTLFLPTKSTLLAAIWNNHFVGWPGLTEYNVKRYLSLQEPTILGHLDQQRQGTRSTNRTRPLQHLPPLPAMIDTPLQPTPPFGDQPTNSHPDDTQLPTEHADDYQRRTHHVYLSIQDLPTGRVFTDQTGPFHIVSSQGTKAVMVLYDYDSNAILIEGITSRGKTELLRAYTHLLNRLHQAGLKPLLH